LKRKDLITLLLWALLALLILFLLMVRNSLPL
jgi:hypothetical protein